MTTSAAVILVVDDEEPVLRVTRKILESAGYQVLEAHGGVEAHRYLDRQIDLIIADLEMPGLRGDDVVRSFQARYPDMKVLYVSGYVDELLRDKPFLWANEAFLEKPTSADGLLEAVSLLLYGSVRPPKT